MRTELWSFAFSSREPGTTSLENALMRQHDRHLNLSARAQHLERYFLAMATNPQIDAGGAELEIAQHYLIEKFGEARIAQANLAPRGIEFETQCCLKQREGGRARPGLRRASDGIEHRTASPFALKPAEQFGQSPQIHIARGVEQTLEQMSHRMLQAVAGEAERDQGIVVRPDRAVGIGHRVVSRLAPRDGADAPPREELLAHEIGSNPARTFRTDDAGEQQLAGIGGSDLARMLGAIEGQRVSAKLLAPECLLEAIGEQQGFGFEPCRPIGHSETARATRSQTLAGEYISLDFGQCDIAFGKVSIGVEDSIEGVLPAL